MASGSFTCPSPPLPAPSARYCQQAHSITNTLSVVLPDAGGAVAGQGVIDGTLLSGNCLYRTRLDVTVEANFPNGMFGQPGTSEDPLSAQMNGNQLTGQAGALFFTLTVQ